ncbi:MAG TPA: cyclase family protein [Pyrinomonadaceae bacterium]|jgi:kynurenine formamidase
MKIKWLLLLTVSCLATACASRQEAAFAGEWLDLSYDFSEQTIYWVETDGFKKETVAEGQNERGYYYSAYRFCTPEHGGTHLDAPRHFAEGRQTVDEVPLDKLIGAAVKIDVSSNAQSNPDYQISIEDLKTWEAQNGAIPEGGIVLFQTGYGKFWGDREKYMGSAPGSDQKHFPGLGKEAANWLIDNRKVKAVGIDTASIDFGQSQTFDTHVALMTQNVSAFENVASIEKLPVKGATVIALPMKIKGGSGAPLRIVAFVPK